MTFHIRKWKEKKKDEIKALAEEYPFIAVVTLNELPADISSLIRKRLAGEAVLAVAKTRVVRIALKEANFETKKLDPLVADSVAIIFSKKNPFELFSFVKKNKGNASAKVGDIATENIVIQAGDSGLPPGPALSTLKAAGLQVKVAGPTIELVKDKVVTKKGEEVTQDVANVLGLLNMKPMKIGMKILGVYDKAEDEFYSADVLDVDEEELFDKFVTAYQQGLNFAVNAEIFNDVSVELIVIKAEREAKAISDAVESDSGEEKKEEPVKEAEEKSEEASKEKKEDAEATPQDASVEDAQKGEEKPVEEAKEEPKEEEKPDEETKEEAPAEEVKEEAKEEPKEEKKEEAPLEEKK